MRSMREVWYRWWFRRSVDCLMPVSEQSGRVRFTNEHDRPLARVELCYFWRRLLPHKRLPTAVHVFFTPSFLNITRMMHRSVTHLALLIFTS